MMPLPTPRRFEQQTGATPLPYPLPAVGPDWLPTFVRQIASNPLLPPLEVQDAAPAGPHVRISCEKPPAAVSGLPDSRYSISIHQDLVTVHAPEPAGVVQALRALDQMRDPAGSVLRCTVEDAPRFPYRGVHLDVCRHFFDAAFVMRLLNLMASLGLNVFHWHLTEDQGWRIPVDRYPRLIDVGSARTQDDGTVYAGYYTTDEITRVIRHAQALGILVIPEIELPGHAQAAVAAYPQLSCSEAAVPVRTAWGVSEEVLCPGKESTFEFLQGVLAHVMEIFPSRFIHIGGDECPKTRWRSCPACQQRIRDQGLHTEEELQSYTIARVARYLSSHGRHAVGWDEILEGGLPEGTTVMSWRGTAGGIEAARLGHTVIMTPTSHCYFDYRQSNRPDEPGVPYNAPDGRPALVSFDRVLQFDPTDGLDEQDARKVLGGQANVWTEQMPTAEHVERKVAPRVVALAETLWHGPASDAGAIGGITERARAWLPRLEAISWRWEQTL